MKVSMANFFPMLSSSPPPIDDADDSPEKDDDDFGIFTTAGSAYDHSFDSPIFDKGAKSKNKFQPIRSSVDDSPEKLSKTNYSKLPENDVSLGTKFYPSSPPKDDELPCKFSNDCQNKHADGIVDHAAINSCDSSVLPHPACSNSNSPCKELEELNDSQCKDSESVGSESSHEIKEPPTAADTNEHIKQEVCNAPESNGVVCDGLCRLQLSDTGSQNINLNVTTEGKGIKQSSPERRHSLDINSGDISSHSNLSECSVPQVEDPSSTKWNSPLNESPKLDPASLSASDVPDLTFIPFPNEESGEEIDDFEEFRDYGYNQESTYTVVDDQLSKVEAGFCKSAEESEVEDEDFGNFEGVVASPGHDFQNSVTNNVKDCEDVNEFADFESNAFQESECWTTVESTEEADDFADFEEAKFEPQSKIPIASAKDSEKGIDKLSTVFNTVFDIPEDAETSTNSEKICEVLDQNCKSRRLWEKLHDTEQTPGLPFQWSVSHSFQQMLRSVNVDYHSILRTSTVPFFASGLGLLEPTKGTTSATESTKSEEDNHSSKDPIPPVEFDWGSSGLVNPLDSGQAISTLMDLSFLNSSSNMPHKDSNRDLSLEEELLATDTTAVECNDCSKKPPIWEQLLSLGAKSSVLESYPGSRPPNLSQEAVHVLDQLPDISFMRAQVLMFPVTNSN